MLEINTRYPVVLTVHDECCIVAPETEAEDAFAFVTECMKTPPTWAHGLPVTCDGGFAVRYGDIK